MPSDRLYSEYSVSLKSEAIWGLAAHDEHDGFDVVVFPNTGSRRILCNTLRCLLFSVDWATC